MTRRHFIALAAALAKTHALPETVEAIADVCAGANSLFDRERFVTAATSEGEFSENLAVCEEDHGAPHNMATVYGHSNNKTCIRLAGTRVWVYSPGVSAFEEEAS